MRNILVDACQLDYMWTYKFYNAKLADFGLAKEYDKDATIRNHSKAYLKGYSEPITTSIMLPWPLMAPELLFASDQPGHKEKVRFFTESTDIWAFGILGAELLNLKEGSCRICDNSDSLITMFLEDMHERNVKRIIESFL